MAPVPRRFSGAAAHAGPVPTILALPQRADGDWSIELPAGCTCELCSLLRKFLAGPDRVFEWPLAEQRRRHVHERIDRAELPVTHVTRRQGRPYTLVLTKTDALFTGERDARATATADLKWLAAHWPGIRNSSSRFSGAQQGDGAATSRIRQDASL